MSTNPGDSRLRGASVLVVEDDSVIYYMLEDFLTELGCAAVWRAADVESALHLLRQRRPNLAILDLNLTGKSSYPVAVRLDEIGVPIVFSTGYGRSGMPDYWRSRPAVQKPFTLAQLGEVLEEAASA